MIVQLIPARSDSIKLVTEFGRREIDENKIGGSSREYTRATIGGCHFCGVETAGRALSNLSFIRQKMTSKSVVLILGTKKLTMQDREASGPPTVTSSSSSWFHNNKIGYYMVPPDDP
jgi:hypothetical protein